MTHIPNENSEKLTELRQRAEDQINYNALPEETSSIQDVTRLLHELRVYSIELELQNDELRAAQLNLEASRRKYIDLYEFTPVGLFILDHNRRIHEPNLTLAVMLGIAPHKLASQDISMFIEPTAQDAFHKFYQALKRTHQPQQCEIVMVAVNQELVVVRLEGVVFVEATHETTYRISVSNITAQKRAEVQHSQLLVERQKLQVLVELLNGLP